MSKILLHTPDGVRDIYGKECSDRKYIRVEFYSQKTQEVLGQDYREGLRILEESYME